MFVYLPSEKERVAKELASTDGMSLGRPSRVPSKFPFFCTCSAQETLQSPPPTRAVSPPSRVVPPPQRQQDGGLSAGVEVEAKQRGMGIRSESYVMCEFEKPGNVEEEEATPPPPRPVGQLKGKTPGQRREHRYGDGTEKWEIPEFGGGKVAALSLSSYDFLGVAAGAGTGAVPKLSPSQSQQTQAQQPQQTLTSDDLMVVWGRVGVEVREVATGLYEKSKRALIGDGTYRGFVDATLSQVPNAAATPDSYGYLIYQQTGSSVQKRASEILPGDIVW
ncbi:assembly of actin patch protein [Marasmius sp. AFHP31]|nr:assembly of actin patch protein [Marasmius sp. AFHP31]